MGRWRINKLTTTVHTGILRGLRGGQKNAKRTHDTTYHTLCMYTIWNTKNKRNNKLERHKTIQAKPITIPCTNNENQTQFLPRKKARNTIKTYKKKQNNRNDVNQTNLINSHFHTHKMRHKHHTTGHKRTCATIQFSPTRQQNQRCRRLRSNHNPGGENFDQ